VRADFLLDSSFTRSTCRSTKLSLAIACNMSRLINKGDHGSRTHMRGIQIHTVPRLVEVAKSRSEGRLAAGASER
jgi:hypothetical protein